MARRKALWLVLAMPALPISAGSEELQYEHGKLTSIIHFDSFSDYEIVTDSCSYIGRLTAGKETPAARRYCAVCYPKENAVLARHGGPQT